LIHSAVVIFYPSIRRTEGWRRNPMELPKVRPARNLILESKPTISNLTSGIQHVVDNAGAYQGWRIFQVGTAHRPFREGVLKYREYYALEQLIEMYPVGCAGWTDNET
jgi:hypothetical protein